MANTIKLRSAADIQFEYVASEAIKPGYLLEITSTGNVKPCTYASRNAFALIALEDELQGKGIDDNYASGDVVQCWYAQPGDIAYLILTTSQQINIGDYIESAGNGLVQKHVPDSTSSQIAIYTKNIVGIALEAVTTTSQVARIKVLII